MEKLKFLNSITLTCITIILIIICLHHIGSIDYEKHEAIGNWIGHIGIFLIALSILILAIRFIVITFKVIFSLFR